MMDRKSFGVYGENIAGKYLRKNGYKILQKNFRTKFGEIDIIAKENDVIAFVEVKTRESGEFASPFLSIDKNKQKHIIKASLVYLKSKKILEKHACRFDVISVISNDTGSSNKVELIKDAFRL